MPKAVKTSLILCLCLVSLACAFLETTRQMKPTHNTLSNNGHFAVETLEFPDLIDPTRERKVPIKVHLPAVEEETPLPLVIVSHGGGGNWDANYAQAQHLATHGYVVLALEHIGSNTVVMKRGGRLGQNLKAMTRAADEVLGRPLDVSFAIDQAQEWNQDAGSLAKRIDLDHIGLLGYSYGAYTTLVVAGARPALDWLEPPVSPGKGLGPDLSDGRVDCGVALSPQGPGEPFFIEDSYSSIKIPLLGVSGDRDRQQGAKPENRLRGFELWPAGDKYLIWLTNVDHTAFSDSTGSGNRMLPSRAREDVQPLVRAATLLFFDACLKGEQVALEGLSVAGLEPYLQGVVDGVEVLKK